jgi:hypothetical protein
MELLKKALTPDEQEEATLASFWNRKFKDSMVAKAPYTKRWVTYWDAYRGDYLKNTSKPDYKSDLISNYIFSVVETIRPIMFDNDPKFQAIPRQPEGMEFSNDMQEALSFEWDREDMTVKSLREAITMLVTGTAVCFIPWDNKEKNVKGIWVSPDNIFPDPLATTVDDAGYIIYAKYMDDVLLKRAFPKKAERLNGGQINYGELVNDNNKNAQITNKVLVLEIYAKDHESVVANQETGVPELKYPKGRVLTVCPEIGLVLSDKQNSYEDGEFPFELVKDYDVPGKFWGEGEVAQLLSPQHHMNELNNSILDNAKSTANMPWIIDKNSGIGEGKITSRPGLVIRKNPGAEVRREQAPNMPNYVINAVETYKSDMEQISGIFDSIKGNSETGVYTAQGVLALQEAGQARIRLKVKLLENSLSGVAKKWTSRMRQFWKEDRFIAVTRYDGTYDVKQFNSQAFHYDYDVKITAGSTMPVNRGAMLDLMIRLAQTQMPDGQNLVDREAVVQYLPEEAKSSLLRRMNGKNDQLAQQVEQINQALQENQKQDEQTMQTLEGLTGALEKLNKQILQLSDKHDKLEKEKADQDKLNQTQKDSYNSGYGDAEKDLTPSPKDSMSAPPMTQGVGAENVQQDAGLPDDIMHGLESMSDDELALVMQQHPELQDLIK